MSLANQGGARTTGRFGERPKPTNGALANRPGTLYNCLPGICIREDETM